MEVIRESAESCEVKRGGDRVAKRESDEERESKERFRTASSGTSSFLR